MKKTETAVASTLVTLSPLTVEQRANQRLVQVRAYVDSMPPEGQMNVAFAMGELKGWAEEHGVAGDLALAIFQLERMVQASEPSTAH